MRRNHEGAALRNPFPSKFEEQYSRQPQPAMVESYGATMTLKQRMDSCLNEVKVVNESSGNISSKNLGSRRTSRFGSQNNSKFMNMVLKERKESASRDNSLHETTKELTDPFELTSVKRT